MKLHSTYSPICNVHIGYDTDKQDRPTNEQWAVAAAMFSRSVDGIEEILKKISADKSSTFMDQFYIGYGHGSIGDLCNVNLFIEGVPIYIACLLEHHSRFRGQEASTRYINFAKQRPAYDADKIVYDNQIDIYLKAVDKVSANILAAMTPDDSMDSAMVARAIKARAFDICRSLLPWGATTNVAWYGDVRVITQHLAWLISDKNPNRDYANVKPYVETIYAALQDFLPSSVTKVLGDTRSHEAYPYPKIDSESLWFDDESNVYQMEYSYQAPDYALDFGSWRDLNRHRIGQQIVNFKTRFEMHSWYDNMLSSHEIEHDIPGSDCSINERLLGEKIEYSYLFHETQLDYIVFRRGQDDVHPTLRNNVLRLAAENGKIPPPGEVDPGALGFFLRRGGQTILIKGVEKAE